MKHITIFTDGSSRGNPGPGGYAAVIVTQGVSSSVVECGGRENSTTNNRMELTAALEALRVVDAQSVTQGGADGTAPADITIYSDSSYVINGITKWVFGWQKKGWITSTKDEVVNRDIWEALVAVSQGKKISWKYVGGHVGIAGNERCDEIATSMALSNSGGSDVSLYSGSLEGYSIKNILDISAQPEAVKAKKSSSSRSRATAYSYISMIDGKVMVHKTWAECEARVKGKGGARYKKALSKEEELAIISEFS